MMKRDVQDSRRQAGASLESHSTLETSTSRREAESHVAPVGKGSSHAKKRLVGYVFVCVVILVAVVVSVAVVIGKKVNGGSKNGSLRSIDRNEPQGAPPPDSYNSGSSGASFSSSPAPAIGVADPPPRFSPLSLIVPKLGPAPSAMSTAPSPSLDRHAPYETICNKTIDRVGCLNMLRSDSNSHKGGLKQWTVTAMEAAQHAVNESYTLAQGMMKKGGEDENVALQQCVDVFADALGNVNASMVLVSKMDVDHNSGKAGGDVQTFMSAAMTDCDTCGEGIDDAGAFPGSDRITGQYAKHVDTMLSIALTFVNHLIDMTLTVPTSTLDRNHHHRHLLHVEFISGSSGSISLANSLSGNSSLGLDRSFQGRS